MRDAMSASWSGDSAAPKVVCVTAPAKINPHLEVLSKRADGYHELDMLMLAINLVDELEVRRGSGERGEVSLQVSELSPGAAAGCPSDATNLAWRAAAGVRALAGELGREPAALELHLQKRIPSEAGLGGGSSDAAAAVLGAATVLGLDLDNPGLVALLSELGSDCAFFLAARATGAARCGGRGERIKPLELPAFEGADEPHVLLLTPAVRSSTPAVYAALELPSESEQRSTPELGALLRGEESPFCRLEGAAIQAFSQLGEWRVLLSEVTQDIRAFDGTEKCGLGYPGSHWGTFTLSGSGSSFFAFLPNRDFGERLLATVRVAAKARHYGLRHASVVALNGAGVALQ
ncbi:MAG: 4-diphosphocytidyl-2-C-methyl-D-erythritol kinase [Planctomycetota bacterium]|jgi:4-diphosphocytidyl-2-C-methyl-D-erythritol kinase